MYFVRGGAVGGQQVVGQYQRGFGSDRRLSVPAPVGGRSRGGHAFVLSIHQPGVDILHGRAAHVLVDAGVLERPLRSDAGEFVGSSDNTTSNQRQADGRTNNVFGLLPRIRVGTDTRVLLHLGLQVRLPHLGGDFAAHDLRSVNGQLLAQRLPRRSFEHGLEDSSLHRLGEFEHLGEGYEIGRRLQPTFNQAGLYPRFIRLRSRYPSVKSALFGVLELGDTKRHSRSTYAHSSSNRSRCPSKRSPTSGGERYAYRRHRHLHGLGDIAENRMVLHIG